MPLPGALMLQLSSHYPVEVRYRVPYRTPRNKLNLRYGFMNLLLDASEGLLKARKALFVSWMHRNLSTKNLQPSFLAEAVTFVNITIGSTDTDCIQREDTELPIVVAQQLQCRP